MVQNSSEKPRGRPRAYDRAAALKAMRHLFWEKGYAATSLDDLSAATGMNRPSLYGAVGDKRALFMKALMSYRERGEGVMARLGAERGRVRETLSKAYEAALDIYF